MLKKFKIYFPEYADFLEAFREKMMTIASEFVLGEEAGEGRRLEQVSESFFDCRD